MGCLLHNELATHEINWYFPQIKSEMPVHDKECARQAFNQLLNGLTKDERVQLIA